MLGRGYYLDDCDAKRPRRYSLAVWPRPQAFLCGRRRRLWRRHACGYGKFRFGPRQSCLTQRAAQCRSAPGVSTAANSGQDIERLKAGVQSLAWSNRASRPRRIGTKLDHQVFHRIDEILLRDISGSVRIERIPYRISTLRFENRRRIERLKCLIKLGLIDRATAAVIPRSRIFRLYDALTIKIVCKEPVTTKAMS